MSESFQRLREIVARLRAPGGCPWDREQTHRSLRANLLEEACEVVEAIDHDDSEHLREELGDLLLQVVMHSQIAAEDGRFDLDEVAADIAAKLVRRHPHVFGDKTLADAEAVLQQWDEIKRAERGGSRGSLLNGVSAALPALMRAQKIQQRAARVGFDWNDFRDVLAKLREEATELEQALDAGEPREVEEEVGDLLFSVVNLARQVRCDAEVALRAATEKFMNRFSRLEQEAARAGTALESLSLEEMDAIWNRIKAAAAATGGQPSPSPSSNSL